MTGNGYVFFGIDWGSKGGDASCEVELERLPDGTIRLKDMRTWKHDLELEANKPAIVNQQETQT